MKVAIIGAGNVGKALGASIARANHQVTLSARTPQSAQAAAQQIGAQAAASNVDAVTDADLVILAVPYGDAGQAVANEIREAVAGRAIVDVTNPIKRDLSGLATDGSSAAEELQKLLPNASVVKAFNTVFASHQAQPSANIDVYVAGDDADAKRTVAELAEAIGFRSLDVGSLSAARHLEGMAFINIGLNAANGWGWTSAWKLER